MEHVNTPIVFVGVRSASLVRRFSLTLRSSQRPPFTADPASDVKHIKKCFYLFLYIVADLNSCDLPPLTALTSASHSGADSCASNFSREGQANRGGLQHGTRYHL